MPRDKWVPTTEYAKRNRWLTRTRGQALQALKEMHPRDYQRILNKIRDEDPCPCNDIH